MPLTQDQLLQAYQRLEKPLFNVLYRWLWHADDCEDVMQETFLRVFAASARLDAGQLDSLIYRSALNLARNRLRWRRVKQFLTFESMSEQMIDSEPDPERAAEQGRLRSVLEQLPPESRNLLLLSEFAGLSTEEIASVLQIATGTVGSRKHRALTRLRALLGDGETR